MENDHHDPGGATALLADLVNLGIHSFRRCDWSHTRIFQFDRLNSARRTTCYSSGHGADHYMRKHCDSLSTSRVCSYGFRSSNYLIYDRTIRLLDISFPGDLAHFPFRAFQYSLFPIQLLIDCMYSDAQASFTMGLRLTQSVGFYGVLGMSIRESYSSVTDKTMA
jgi:hypothetical protein